MNRYAKTTRQRLVGLILVTTLGLCSFLTPNAHSADCNPQSLAGRAAAGAIVNGVLGRLNQIIGTAAGVQNGISPTPSSALTDCVLPAINPRPPMQPPLGGPITSFPHPEAQSWGDPHLITLDGLAYDFHGAGDFAYVESDLFTLQGRHVPSSSGLNVARLTGIAISFNSDTVVIGDSLEPSVGNTELALVTVNGQDMLINRGGWIDLDDQGSYIQRFARDTYIRLEGVARILINNNSNNLRLALDSSLAGEVSGLLGDFDGDATNDLVTGVGTVFTVDNTETLYGAFLSSWQRSGEASLFNTPFEQIGVDQVVPEDLSSLAGVSSAQREAAAQRCLDGGVGRGFPLYACIFDLVFDDDEQWIEAAALISNNNIDLVPATSLVNPVGGRVPLSVDAVVTSEQPVSGAGVLANPFEVDQYSVTIPSGINRVLQVNSPCRETDAPSVLLQTDGSKGQELSLACNSNFSLPVGSSVLSVFSNAGDAVNYAFSLVEPALTDLGLIALDTNLSGSIGLNEQLVGTLPSQSGDRIFFASNLNAECGRQWQLLDSNDEIIARAQQCTDLGLISVGESTPYQLAFEPGELGSYAFRVISVGADTVQNLGNNIGQRVELQINTPGQQASLEFSVMAGQRLYVDREGGVLSGRLVVRGPNGEELARSAAQNEDLLFESMASGNHTVTLEPASDFTGTVPVTVVSVADDTRINVVRGQQFELTLVTPGQRAVAIIDATAGETFTVTLTGSGTLARLQPPGDEQGILIFGNLTFTAEVAGVYEIAIGPSDGFVGTIGFDLQ